MKFIKIIKIEQRKFSYIFDENITINEIRTEHFNDRTPGLKYVLHFQDKLKTDHFTNISKLLLQVDIPNTIITIKDLMNKFLTDLLIYGYETNLIDPPIKLVGIIDSDYYPAHIKYKPYNILTENIGSYYANNPDLLISLDGINLNKKLLIADGLLYNTAWTDDKLIVKNGSDIRYTYRTLSFLDFSGAEDVQTRSLKSMKKFDYFIIPWSPIDLREGYDIFIVLQGHPFFLHSDRVTYGKEDITEHKIIKLDWDYFLSCEQFEGQTTGDIIGHNQSFICFVKCNKLLYRYQTIFKDINNLYSAYLQESDLRHGSYICHDNFNKFHRITIVDPLYKNPIYQVKQPHKIYINDEDIKNGTITDKTFYLMNILIT